MDQAIEDAVDEIIDMDLRMVSPVTGKEVCYVKVVEPEDSKTQRKLLENQITRLKADL